MLKTLSAPAGQALCVGQASQLFGLTTRAIRFYEARGLVRSVRDHTNKRWFDDKARRQLQFIAKMRRAGLTISAIGGILEKADREGGRDYMALAVESLSARLETLERERLEVLTALTAITDDEQARPTPAAPCGLTRRLAAHRQADMAEL